MIGEFVYVGVGLVGDGQGVACGIAAGGLVKGVYGAGQASVQVGVADVHMRRGSPGWFVRLAWASTSGWFAGAVFIFLRQGLEAGLAEKPGVGVANARACAAMAMVRAS